MTKFAVKFLGCKVSQADAMAARGSLLKAGHAEVPEADAELHVINTCCITSEAEAKSRQAVRRSLNDGRAVYVAGCAVNLNGERFSQIDPRVTVFVGTAEDVALRMAGALGACADLEHETLAAPRSGTEQRTRGFVKVQDGCDCRCAYCSFPPSGVRRARVRRAVCSPRCAAGWPPASPRS